MKINVDAKHREYTAHEKQWARARDCYEGADAVKAKDDEYLPPLDAHVKDKGNAIGRFLGGAGLSKYQQFKERAPFYNAVRRTVNGLAGLVFQKEPGIEFGKPKSGAKMSRPPWADDLRDVTLTDRDVESEAYCVTRDVLLTGRHGVLVDWSTRAARPYWAEYTAEDIVNWRVERIGGDPTLTMVVLRESVDEPKPGDPYTVERREQYRVLRLVPAPGESFAYEQEVFRKEKNTKTGQEEWLSNGIMRPERKGRALDFIPFVFVGPSGVTPDVDMSPVIDLVDLNLFHFWISALFGNVLQHVGSPFLVVKDQALAARAAKEGPIDIGPSRVLFVASEGGAEIVQTDGGKANLLTSTLDRTQQQMATLGARLLEEQPRSAETATAVGMRHSGEHATLRAVAQSVEQALTYLLQVHGWWSTTADTPQDVEVRFELNKDFFAVKLSAEEAQILTLQLQADAISFKTFWAKLTDGSWVPPGITAEEETERIEARKSLYGTPAPGQQQPPGAEDGDQVVQEGNPYKLVKRNEHYIVVKADTGETVKDHGTGPEALARARKHLGALERNVKD